MVIWRNESVDLLNLTSHDYLFICRRPWFGLLLTAQACLRSEIKGLLCKIRVELNFNWMNGISISGNGWYNNNELFCMFDNSVLNCHATVSWKMWQSAWQSGVGCNDRHHNSITVCHTHTRHCTDYKLLSIGYNLEDDHDAWGYTLSDPVRVWTELWL